MIKSLKIYGWLFLFLLSGVNAYSTHLKAGEIIARRLSGSQFEIKLYLYTDSSSVIGLNVDEPTAILNFSDGTSDTVSRDAPGRIYIGNATFKNVYTFIRAFNNSTYTISYKQENRNANIRNINNGASDNTPFYIETIIKVSPFIGQDNLPILLVPPIDFGSVGQIYIHNPGAFDPEGDSLSYELTTPKQGVGTNVSNYVLPNMAPPGGTFSLNPITGDLIWDAPLVAGLYNVAFIIKEWRNGQVIGSIVRDMQIRIEDNPNRRPILQIPRDTCIEAGTILNIQIIATDPDGHNIIITPTSGIIPPATFNPTGPQPNPASATFRWETNCSNVRDEPYQVIFKAEDIPTFGRKLFDMRSWNIRVIAPAPKNLQVTTIDKGFQLNWDLYECSNANKIQIYRKVCDSSDAAIGPCDDGISGQPGFTKIGEVPVGVTTFKDTVNINPGSFYFYKIFATFPLPKGGQSYTSSGVVGKLSGQPIPTNVSVIKTDSLNGKIMVKWTQPINLNATAFPGPYEYRLYRASGLSGTSYSLIKTLTNIADTMIVDSLINTMDDSFHYRLDFYYTGVSGLTLKSTSIQSSSVFLTSAPGGNKVTLQWTYNTPWDNKNQYHRIYKKNNADVFVLIDSVFVTGGSGTFVDTGLTNGDTVCYYVQTQGEYCSLPILLMNNSQIVCEVPRDTLPPCPPILFGPVDCIEDGVVQLTVNWIPDLSPGCNTDIKGYNLYYAEHEDDELQLIAASVSDTFFVDVDVFSLAGCYAVTAMNYYGAESAKSNKVCVDLCVYYDLPNLITPNRDKQNDIFVPFPVPKNVQQVKFSVFNRWGKRIYYSEDDIHLNWPGVDAEGNNLPSGVYFFHAEVTFKRRLRKADNVKHIKGWVHIVRKEDGEIEED